MDEDIWDGERYSVLWRDDMQGGGGYSVGKDYQ